MSLNLNNLPLSYNESITTLMPKLLEKGKLCDSLLRSRTKKEAEMEIKAMTLSQIRSFTSLLKSIENRFWVYDKVLPYSGQSYSLCFKSFDNMLFNSRKVKLTNLNSLTYAYSARKNILKNRKILFKSRLLALTKKGFKLNFYGQSLYLKAFSTKFVKVKGSKTYKKIEKRSKVSYRSWLILNLDFIGLLTSFRFNKLDLQFLKFGKRKKFDKKWDSYYQGKFGLKSKILIKKN